jgi:hypothetical protein
MWYTLKIYLRDRYLFATFLGACLVQVAIWIYLFLRIPPNSPSIFLHYNILVGVDLVGPAWQLYFLTGIGLFTILINFVFGLFAFNEGRLLARLLGVATVILQLLLLVGVVFIVGLNK